MSPRSPRPPGSRRSSKASPGRHLIARINTGEGEMGALIRQINEEGRVDPTKAHSAFTQAEKSEGEGLEPEQVLSVLQQLLGHGRPTMETEIVSRTFTTQFPPGTTLEFEGDFMELLYQIMGGERKRRKWLLVRDFMMSEAALDEGVARVFRHFDFDGTGVLSMADLDHALRAVEFYLEPGELEVVVASCDEGQGVPEFEIDYGWFAKVVARCTADPHLAKRRRAEVGRRCMEMQAEVEAVFELWDIAGTGRIPTHNAAQGLADCGWDLASIQSALIAGDDGCADAEDVVDAILVRGLAKEHAMERC